MSGASGSKDHHSDTDPFEYAEDDDDLSLSCPKGFVGRANNVTTMKLYMANVSEYMVDTMYMSYAGRFAIDYIKLEAKDSLQNALFSSRRSFSEYYSSDIFVPKAFSTGLTLLELLNFVPTSEANNFFKEDQLKTRIEVQNRLLSSFIFAYKSFQCLVDKLDSASESEEGDTDIIIKMSLAFGPGTVHTLREVGIVTINPTDCLPHGYIDLLVYGRQN